MYRQETGSFRGVSSTLPRLQFPAPSLCLGSRGCWVTPQTSRIWGQHLFPVSSERSVQKDSPHTCPPIVSTHVSPGSPGLTPVCPACQRTRTCSHAPPRGPHAEGLDVSPAAPGPRPPWGLCARAEALCVCGANRSPHVALEHVAPEHMAPEDSRCSRHSRGTTFSPVLDVTAVKSNQLPAARGGRASADPDPEPRAGVCPPSGGRTRKVLGGLPHCPLPFEGPGGLSLPGSQTEQEGMWAAVPWPPHHPAPLPRSEHRPLQVAASSVHPWVVVSTTQVDD